MKYYLHIFVFFASCNYALSQQAFANYGNLKMHPTSQVGFHIDVINDGNSSDNEGLAGFYNQNSTLNFSGVNQMNFEDFEVDVLDDLNLFTSLGVTDNVSFTNGRINTPRANQNTLFKFLNDNTYNGASNTNHIDGFAQFEGDFGFLFPVGDDFENKPLGINNFNVIHQFQAAYFKEDPNTPSTFGASFNTSSFVPSLDVISTVEFWYFDGLKDVDLTLTWTASSNIVATANDLNDLRIAAWDETLQQWINLGNDAITGDFTNGTITARVANSEAYKIYTIASILKAGNEITVFNGMTPDGDGLNDTLIIRGIETIPDNQLFIYNRWGVLVYQKDNYDNSFNGVSNGRNTISSDSQLGAGTYYYILKIPEQEDLAGYFYINR
ncbi:MAG: gliding motility-associated C-terminal domain-containing protein [Nonlabens sp.]|uniref:gliding motility-associated C-terminal domain-containing protein n=1 Tax=Nonlabens sp. TaxID=1888209 RepID=UPI003EFA9B15